MKTITEFPGMSLKNAAKAKQDLITSGKTPEELPAALGETLKVEGTRLEFLVAVLDIVGTKLNDLKRAIVYAPNEGEKAPLGLLQKGEHFYLVEYFPSLAKPGQPSQSADHRHKDGKGDGKKRGRGGRGENRGNNENKGPGFKRPDAQIIATSSAGPASPGGQDRPRSDLPRGPRNPRTPRPPRAIPVVNTGAPVIIKPVTPIAPKTPVETLPETTKET
ncbi:MAG: hypothetical protein ABIQ95_02720 [Bdellovibrionia bacterium]